MLNLILCECKKFKRRQIFILATLAAFIFPIIITALFWNTPDPDFENLFAGIVDYGDFLLLLPILVIVASSMFFTEQDNGTLKNIEMVPVSRNQIVISKLSVMLILAVVYTVGGYLASAVCAKILGMILTGFLTKLILSIALGIMTYIAALPCILLVVWFNKNDIISFLYHPELCSPLYRRGDAGTYGVQYWYHPSNPVDIQMDLFVFFSRAGGIP